MTWIRIRIRIKIKLILGTVYHYSLKNKFVSEMGLCILHTHCDSYSLNYELTARVRSIESNINVFCTVIIRKL